MMIQDCCKELGSLSLSLSPTHTPYITYMRKDQQGEIFVAWQRGNDK